MCYSTACLIYLFIFVVVAFASLIYFSLRNRKKNLKQNMQLTGDQIWKEISKNTDLTAFKKSDLLFSIQQDDTAYRSVFVIKNFDNEIVGRVECPVGSRQYRLWVGPDLYKINFLFQGWRSSQLISELNFSELAAYKMLNMFGQHKIQLLNYGLMISERKTLTWKNIFYYRMDNKLIGLKQRISATRDTGNLVILPNQIPLHLRIFILAM